MQTHRFAGRLAGKYMPPTKKQHTTTEKVQPCLHKITPATLHYLERFINLYVRN